MEEDSISSPTRSKINRGEPLRAVARQSRSKPSEDAQLGSKGHPRALKSTHSFRNQAITKGNVHVQAQSDPSSLPPTEVPRKNRADSTHLVQPDGPPRRAKSTPSQSGHQVGGQQPPTVPPPAGTKPPQPAPNHSPTMPARVTESPNPTHKPMAASATAPASRKPPLGSFASVPAQPQHLDPARQKMLDRAIKARLYFLRQSGPNKFLIGGDSMDSRFHVNIGPQTCSCNKVHCLHLLFVMLRVLKVKQSSPMLWSKQLRNYEAESLLGDFQTRVKRTASRKGSRKKFDFLRRGSDLRNEVEGVAKSLSVESVESVSSLPVLGEEEGLSPALTVEGVSSEEGDAEGQREGGDGEEGGDSDKEEDICPICLNELDEGEDLLVCPGCNNHLHQHCMDIWAMEERRKNEPVHCPVCRALWPYHMTSPSGNFALDANVPVAGERASPSSKVSTGTLSQEKRDLLDKLKELFGMSGVEGLFSADWKAREMALTLTSREAISLLLPQLSNPSTGSEVKDTSVHGTCMEVVRHSCGDSVLKVFLASLELFKVVLGYSVCHTTEEATHLQQLISPVLLFLLTRCADAQHRVRDCSIEATCNLCLGQEGTWSLGSSCGQQTAHPATSTPYVLQVAFSGQERENSWQWWLGRLTFMDRILSRFTIEYLLSQCVLEPAALAAMDYDYESDDPSFRSGLASPSDSLVSSVAPSLVSDMSYTAELAHGLGNIDLESSGDTTSETEEPMSFLPASRKAAIDKNLLMQIGYFAARATHIPHRKLGKLARRVIIKVSKVLRDDPSSLEVVHDIVARCHRTQAEGLLDRVLQARETTYDKQPATSHQGTGSSQHRIYAETGDNGRRKESSGPSKSPTQSDRLRNPPSRSRDQSTSPSTRGKTSPLPPPPTAHAPLASSSLTGSAEEARVQSSFRSTVVKGQADKKEKKSRGTGLEDEGATSLVRSEERHRLSKQRSRGGGDSMAAALEEFIPSDESFQSAVSELDLMDCSTDTILAPERAGEEFVGGAGDESSASTSHDSSKSPDTRKHNTSSGSSVEKGVEPVGVAEGFPNKPGFMNYPHLYSRQSTAGSTSSDSLDIGWNCKRNIEEEEAEALAKVRSMVLDDMPHPPLSGLVPPTPQVLIHVQASGKDKKQEDTDGSGGGQPYMEAIHWVKGKLIGTGAFCSCFLARDMENGTMFAVKQVSYARNTRSQEEEELARLRDEVSMLGRINHPNIVRCLGATQHEGHINIFIEWMAGGCLDQLLHDFGYFGENVICNYAKQITHGIVFLHENGIIHRDLKGGNILVDSTGRRLRIADFGAAARLATHTTGSGEFQNMEGTVAFMAPEVVRGGTEEGVGYGRKCDVWSIGCVLIQMATAKPPWAGTYDMKNKFQLIFKIGQATSPPPMPDFQNPALKDFAIRCLEVRPEDRPTSIELLKHPLFTAT